MRLPSLTQVVLGSSIRLDHGGPSKSLSPLVTNSRTNVSYHGTLEGQVEQFLNIFYGQNTGGANRFAPPKPYVPSRNTLIDATTPGAACPQPEVPLPADPYTRLTNVSEDCLTLRIARPANTETKAKLPVVAWLYGGGASVGTIYDSSYDPTGMVRQATVDGSPVIYVAINYRVNIFGYAASNALREENSLNVALRDQRLGLEWIRDHIEAFGGDPDNVTVFGEDEGATDIGLHLLAYGGQASPPFRQAIAQSGSALSDYGVDGDVSAKHFAEVAKKVDCASWSTDSDATIECLRELPMDVLVNATFEVARSVEPVHGFRVFIPTVDGDFLPDAPSNLIRTGQFARGVPLLTGWNQDEASIYTPSDIATEADMAKFLARTFPHLTPWTINTLVALYPTMLFAYKLKPNDTVTPAYYAVEEILRDITVACPTLMQGLAMSKYPDAPVYLYELAQSPFAATMAEYGRAYLGVSHFADVPYVFNELESAYGITEPAELRLAKRVSGSWARFAHHGRPDGKVRGKRGGAVGLPGRWPEAFEDNTLFPQPPDAEVRDNRPLLGVSLRTIGGPADGANRLRARRASEMPNLLDRCNYINELWGQLMV